MSGVRRDELDAWVKSLTWTDADLEYNSPQRRSVAARLSATTLVEWEVDQIFPNEEQRDRMIEYTKTRVLEKILGKSIESNPKQWNFNGLWDPLSDTSFCGWVRRLSQSICKANARRVLHGRAVNDSSLASDEDGYNPAYDDASSVSLTGRAVPTGPFEHVPELVVPRPVGPARDRLLADLTDHDADWCAGEAYRLGYWHRTMERLSGPREQCALLLAPIPNTAEDELVRMVPATMAECARRYAPTQMSGRKVDVRALDAAVRRYARDYGVFRWDVWCVLGTAAARLACA